MSENKTPQTVENNLTLEQVKEELVETGKKSGVLANGDAEYDKSLLEDVPMVAVVMDLSVPLEVKMNDVIGMYLRENGRVDLLSAEEEVELAKRIKENDEMAARDLAEAFLRLVVSIA